MFGVDVYVTEHALGEEWQDWSGCRSPSRARRRHAQGHKTRMVVRCEPACYKAGGQLLIHPALQRQLKDRIEKDMMEALGASGSSTNGFYDQEPLSIDKLKESMMTIRGIDFGFTEPYFHVMQWP